MFSKKKLSSGVEGVVYSSNLLEDPVLHNNIVIKVTDIKLLIKNKNLSSNILNRNPLYIYELFERIENKDKNFSLLIESIAYTLIDQLVLQKICPLFNINYYWEYQGDVMNYYNEKANTGTLNKWFNDKTDVERLNVFMQVILGIFCLQRYFNMIHGDLHSDNVLIQRVKPGGTWKYIIDNTEYIVPNIGWMIIINDFGFATILKHVELDWYVQEYLKFIDEKAIGFYDFCYFIESIDSLLSYTKHSGIHQTIHDILKQLDLFSVFEVIKNNKISKKTKKSVNYYYPYKMINVLQICFKNYSTWYPNNNPPQIIGEFNFDKKFNKDLLPNNFKKLVLH